MKSKPTKQINNTHPAKPSAPPPTHSNLLGKVDLDDEDDLLLKYQPKKPPVQHDDNDQQEEFTSSMNKFNSNIQIMIDSKWSQYKTSFDHQDEEEEAEKEEEEEEDFYPSTRYRTSSRSSGIQAKASSVQPKKVRRSLRIDLFTNTCRYSGFR